MADSPGGRSQIGASGSSRLAAASHTAPDGAAASVSRGRFLTGMTVGLGGLIGAAVAVPALGFAFGPSFRGESWYWVDLGSADTFPFVANVKQRSYTPVTFERTPEGGDIERRIAFVRRNDKDLKAGLNTSAFTVISNTCMHLGCPVQNNQVGFACPCHGGQYDTEGNRNAGPPVRPLNRYEHKIENGHLYIGRPFASELKDGKVVMTNTWKDPGEPVNGLLSILYPSPPR